MKRLSILILILSMCVFVFAQDIEEEAIKKLVLTAYVDGLQNKGGNKIFTDYLSLYKFEDGWKIVSKIYYKLPE